MEFDDNKLISMICENDEDAKNLIYEKYNYIIEIILAKYRRTFYALGIDQTEAKQEAYLGFSDALIKYSESKSTSLPTFISLVVERKIQNCVRKAETQKSKLNNESLSLEGEFENFTRPLEEVLGDSKLDPLNQMEDAERYNELKKMIDEQLSPLEKEVYELMLNDFGYQDIAKILNKEPKQIDNTIQRIRNKIKDLIN